MSEIKRQLESQLYSHMVDKIWEQIDNKVPEYLSDRVWNEMGAEIRFQTTIIIRAQMIASHWNKL